MLADFDAGATLFSPKPVALSEKKGGGNRLMTHQGGGDGGGGRVKCTPLIVGATTSSGFVLEIAGGDVMVGKGEAVCEDICRIGERGKKSESVEGAAKRSAVKAVGGGSASFVGISGGVSGTTMKETTDSYSSPLSGSASILAAASTLGYNHNIQNQMNTSSSSATMAGCDCDSSPATPFRFHSFPASLPRVHPRSIAGDTATGVTSLFSSTPFRLDESLVDTGGKSPSSPNVQSEDIQFGSEKIILAQNSTPTAAGVMRERLPSSPAKRRLLARKYGTVTSASDSNATIGSEFSNAIEQTDPVILPLAPSFDAADDGAALTGRTHLPR